MGKKSKDKNVKKEEKPKKEEAVKSTINVQAALEGITQNRAKAAASPARTSESKKAERSFDPTRTGCQDSFKWDLDQTFPELPKFPELPPIVESGRSTSWFPLLANVLPRDTEDRGSKLTGLHTACTKGWTAYFLWRCGEGNHHYRGEGEAKARELDDNKFVRDGLSSPLTVAGTYLRILMTTVGRVQGGVQRHLNTGLPLHLVVIGASAANEERILKETDYWDELGYLLAGRKVRLYLTGKEMSGNDVKTRQNLEEGLDMLVECWRGTTIDFFLEKGRLDTFKAEETMAVGLNCGFGIAADVLMQADRSHVADLPFDPPACADVIWSWLPAMYFLASVDLDVAMTASSDVDCEQMAVVLKNVVGMFQVVAEEQLLTPFESALVGSFADRPQVPKGEEFLLALDANLSLALMVVRANSYGLVVRGQQLTGFPRVTSLPEPDEPELRFAQFCSAMGSTTEGAGAEHVCVRNDQTSWNSMGDKQLEPLKRYGKYPPEESRQESSREATSTNSTANGAVEVFEDAAMSRAVEGKCSYDPPLPVELQVAFDVDSTSEGVEKMVVTLEDVFIAHLAMARVGVRRMSFVVYYHDCRTFQEVFFESQLPKPVDHTTAKVSFRRSKSQIRLTARLS